MGENKAGSGRHTKSLGPEAAQNSDLVEVVNYESVDNFVWLELAHRYQLRGLLHLTAKSDEACSAFAIHLGLPYIGVTNTEMHSALLRRRLEQLLFRDFLTPGSNRFKPLLAAALGPLTQVERLDKTQAQARPTGLASPAPSKRRRLTVTRGRTLPRSLH